MYIVIYITYIQEVISYLLQFLRGQNWLWRAASTAQAIAGGGGFAPGRSLLRGRRRGLGQDRRGAWSG